MRAFRIFILLLCTGHLVSAQDSGVAAVTGVVLDQTGAVLPGASVDLLTADGALVKSTTADAVGVFRFEQVVPGQYQITARFEGFAPMSMRVRVTSRAPGPQKLVLNIAGLTQEITVSNTGSSVGTTVSGNVDAVSVDTELLESLPVFDHDVIATMSRFLDTGSLGNTGVTIVVNGMEVNGLNVSTSAIQQIRINQDPYSAEYSRPGRGRVEILTKPGGATYHGDLTAVMRDARFNARNAFATEKPPEARRTIDGFLSGPLGTGGKTSFMLSGNDIVQDQQAFVHAVGPDGVIQGSLPQAVKRALVSASITHQLSERNTFSIRPAYQYESNENRDAGGTILASAATTFTHHEQQVTYTQQTVMRPSLINQFQLLVGHEREPTASASSDPGIVVAGAFTGGGGQGDLLRTETHINLNESLAWNTGHHLVQAGFQLPDWSRRGIFDHTNFGGTFYFPDLDAYVAGRPYAFTQQRGNGDVVFLEKLVGAYVKDDWQARPGLSLGLGVRYDWQNYFHDDNNIAPRLSVAFSPGNQKSNVVRAGLGMFSDRSGAAVIADTLHSQPGGLTRIIIENPGYPNPFSGSSASATPGTVRLAPGIQLPQTMQYSVSFDHQLQKATALSVTYTGARGYHLFRSRDVNAPLPPFYLARPDPSYSAIREVESTGTQHSDSLQFAVRGRVTRWFTGQTQYVLSRVYNDTNGLNWFPANDHDLSGEWAPADFDRRHRFLVLGRVTALKQMDLGVGLTMNSGSPYSETLGADIYNNGRGRARPPGVSRNNRVGPGYASLDIRASRDLGLAGLKHGARNITVAVDLFNVLNHVNYGVYVGTIGSPLFGRPVSALAPRQLQASVHVKF